MFGKQGLNYFFESYQKAI